MNGKKTLPLAIAVLIGLLISASAPLGVSAHGGSVFHVNAVAVADSCPEANGVAVSASPNHPDGWDPYLITGTGYTAWTEGQTSLSWLVSVTWRRPHTEGHWGCPAGFSPWGLICRRGSPGHYEYAVKIWIDTSHFEYAGPYTQSGTVDRPVCHDFGIEVVPAGECPDYFLQARLVDNGEPVTDWAVIAGTEGQWADPYVLETAGPFSGTLDYGNAGTFEYGPITIAEDTQCLQQFCTYTVTSWYQCNSGASIMAWEYNVNSSDQLHTFHGYVPYNRDCAWCAGLTGLYYREWRNNCDGTLGWTEGNWEMPAYMRNRGITPACTDGMGGPACR